MSPVYRGTSFGSPSLLRLAHAGVDSRSLSGGRCAVGCAGWWQTSASGGLKPPTGLSGDQQFVRLRRCGARQASRVEPDLSAPPARWSGRLAVRAEDCPSAGCAPTRRRRWFLIHQCGSIPHRPPRKTDPEAGNATGVSLASKRGSTIPQVSISETSCIVSPRPTKSCWRDTKLPEWPRTRET